MLLGRELSLTYACVRRYPEQEGRVGVVAHVNRKQERSESGFLCVEKKGSMIVGGGRARAVNKGADCAFVGFGFRWKGGCRRGFLMCLCRYEFVVLKRSEDLVFMAGIYWYATKDSRFSAEI